MLTVGLIVLFAFLLFLQVWKVAFLVGMKGFWSRRNLLVLILFCVTLAAICLVISTFLHPGRFLRD